MCKHTTSAHQRLGTRCQPKELRWALSPEQARHVERWLACARRAFAELDPDGDGVAQADDIVACLRAKLPPSEVPPLRACPSPAAPREGPVGASAAVGSTASCSLPAALLSHGRVYHLGRTGAAGNDLA